ncbi:MAG: PilW family protein [Candidatus Muiribacteriota bacterium]
MSKQGMTFVEVLISMAVFGVLILASTNLFFSGLNVWEFGESMSRKLHDIDFLFNKITYELNNITPFLYAGLFLEDETFFKEFFDNEEYYDKYSDNIINIFYSNMPDNLKNFFFGEKDNYENYLNYFLAESSYSSETALKSWLGEENNRRTCWQYFNKGKWEEWMYNIPAFNSNDIGVFSSNGFIYYGLGKNFSYSKYRGVSFYYNEEERSVYYYSFFFNESQSIVYNRPEKIIEDVFVFDIKYFSHNNEEIPTDEGFTYILPGVLSNMEIEVELYDSNTSMRKRKIFDFNINKMKN